MKKRLISLITVFIVICSWVPASGATDQAVRSAGALYTMGLLSGTGTSAEGSPDFELDRAPTRQEAVVMLIRLLGREKEAASGSWSHPFGDVDPWADKYVGYAYRMGLAKGAGGAEFGGRTAIGAEEYITFVLRALGYSDSEGDFSWREAHVLSDKIGLTSGEYDGSGGFTRGDIAIISYNALSQKLDGSGSTLVQSLVNSSAVTKAAAVNAGLSFSVNGASGLKVLDAEEIYALCSPAVFQLIIYDVSGRALGAGSGFFIAGSGMAVTNYHVIEGAASAKAVLSSGGAEFEVEGVYDYDEEKDLALIKVSGSGFPYLDVSDAALAGGAAVYAIGSPLGLDNSISEGIVSNPKRVLNGAAYVQITAPISPGSSGGALINAYGQAVGVTSAFVEEGQNINLAVPISLINSLSRGSVRPFSGISSAGASSNGALKSTHSAVTVSAGSYATVLLTCALGENRTLLYEVSDGSVVSVEWGDWIDEYSLPFYITGLSPGNASVTVTLEDQYGRTAGTLVISVTVTGETASGGYSDFPGVPDFGRYASVPAYYSTHTPYSESVTGYSVGYCYRVDAITEVFGDTDWQAGYYELLEDEGFYFSSSFEDDMGFTVQVLENRYDASILCAGVSYIGRDLCFCIVMWENV